MMKTRCIIILSIASVSKPNLSNVGGFFFALRKILYYQTFELFSHSITKRERQNHKICLRNVVQMFIAPGHY